MAYVGEDFQTDRTTVSVRVYDDGQVRFSEFGHGNLDEDEAGKLIDFVRDELYKIKKSRGDFDRW